MEAICFTKETSIVDSEVVYHFLTEGEWGFIFSEKHWEL